MRVERVEKRRRRTGKERRGWWIVPIVARCEKVLPEVLKSQ